MSKPLPETVETLTECGIDFAHIPAGDYPVGYDGESPLACPPQFDFITPLTTPAKIVTVADFFISKEPVRLSHWQNIIIHPKFHAAEGQLSQDDLDRIKSWRVTEDMVEVHPTAGDQQAADFSLESWEIPQQLELDPVLEVEADRAGRIAKVLKASLPRWYEWEIAMRGPEGRLYPWGNTLDQQRLSLEWQDYSVDDEGVMGYYRCDQDVVFVYSFGDYVEQASPFGLTGLARAGREWNVRYEGQPPADDKYILRSISDLGGMKMMIPGFRPGTWGIYGWNKSKKQVAFSGPVLPCYAPVTVGMTQNNEGKWAGQRLYDEAGFRLVVR